MGKYVSGITHKGKEILYLQIPGSSEKDRSEAWEEIKQELLTRKGPSLVLVDARNVTMAPGSLEKAKEAGAAARSHPDNRLAFVGLNALQKSTAQLIARGMHLQAHSCNTLEEGKEWLVR